MKSTYSTLCVIALIMLLPKVSVFAQAEYFDGPRTVYVGQRINYYYNGSSGGNGTWSINGTSASIEFSNEDMATVDIDAFGSFYLGHSNATDGYKEVFINVYNVPPVPYTPYVFSTQCREVTIEMNVSQIPPDVYWFWQRTPNGRSTDLGNTPQLEVTESGWYYLQSRSTFVDDVWGGTSAGIYVTVPTPPVDPSITAIDTQICLNQSIYISTTGGVGTPHYWASSNGGVSWNVFSDAHVGEGSFSFPPASAGTYRILVRNQTPYCGFCTDPGNTCTGDSYVDVVVGAPPSASGELYVVRNVADQNVCVGSEAEISVQNSPGVQYYWISSTGTEDWDVYDAANLGNPFPMIFNTPGEWRIKTRAENECGLSEAFNTISFTVFSPPSGVPVVDPVEPICVGRRATLNATPSNDATGVKWFSAADGPPLNSVPYSGRYQTGVLTASTPYWAASNNIAGCAGQRIPVTATVTPVAIDSDISADQTRICLGQSVLIQISGGTGIPHFFCSTTGGSSWNVFEDSFIGSTSFSHTPQYPGTYRYKVRNATACGLCGEQGNECIYNKYVEVVVDGLPTTGYISGPRTVTLGEAYTYSVPEAVHSTSYQWTILNGEIISGHGTNTVVARFNSKVGQLSVAAISTYCGASFTTSLAIREGLNFIIEEKVLIENILDVDGLSEEGKNKTTTYFDGLGRPIQTVAWKISQSKKDLVLPIVYDRYGREPRKYLPFTMGDDGVYKEKDDFITIEGDYFGVPKTFYQGSGDVAADLQPTAKTVFESSPLNRVLEQGSPGAAWQPDGNNSYTSPDHTVKHAYESNGPAEVILWNYIPATETTPMDVTNTGSFYGQNELSKTKTKDEDNHEVIEFKDKKGRMVLKKIKAPNNDWADTYYIYDDFGNLVIVLPPEAVKALD